MRLSFICILVVSLFAIGQAQTLDKENRIFGWINDNIVKPIEQTIVKPIEQTIIKPLEAGINHALQEIMTGTNQLGSSIQNLLGDVTNLSNQVLDGINVAVNTVGQSLNVAVDMAASIFSPQGQPPVAGGASADLCGTTCFQRIKIDNNVKDFYFNQPNGCISKGYATHHTEIFNSCCDMHNTCLNAQW